jgi:hypothetical protein
MVRSDCHGISIQNFKIQGTSIESGGGSRPNLQQCREHNLHVLHIRKSLHEFRSWVAKTVDTFTEEEFSCHIYCQAVEEILHINGLPGRREQIYHGACPALKNLQVANTILDEHWPNEVSAFVPLLVVGREDRVT